MCIWYSDNLIDAYPQPKYSCWISTLTSQSKQRNYRAKTLVIQRWIAPQQFNIQRVTSLDHTSTRWPDYQGLSHIYLLMKCLAPSLIIETTNCLSGEATPLLNDITTLNVDKCMLKSCFAYHLTTTLEFSCYSPRS